MDDAPEGEKEAKRMTQRCDSKCGFCSTVWWKWLRAREANMRRPYKGPGATAGVSFADAAATSVKPEDPATEMRRASDA